MADLDKLRAEYLRLAHAMQSAVAAKMQYDPNDTEPKHLRVGINSAMSDQMGLAQLLIRKGVITPEEYYEAMVEGMRNELDMYLAWFRARGLPFTFA